MFIIEELLSFIGSELLGESGVPKWVKYIILSGLTALVMTALILSVIGTVLMHSILGVIATGLASVAVAVMFLQAFRKVSREGRDK